MLFAHKITYKWSEAPISSTIIMFDDMSKENDLVRFCGNSIKVIRALLPW